MCNAQSTACREATTPATLTRDFQWFFKMRRLVLAIILFLPGINALGSNWWNKDWRYRQHIGINAEQVSGNIADFPLWVQLSDAQFARTLVRPGGADLRAVGADGRLLALEIVSWKANDVRLYVNIPRIMAGAANQGFDLYFGNPLADAPPAGKIWSDSLLAILHLAGDMKAANRHDATVDREGYVIQNGWTAGLIMERSFPWLTFDGGHKGFLAFKPELARTAGPSLTFTCRFRPTKDGFLTLCSGDGFDFGVHGSDAVYRGCGPDMTLEGVRAGQWQSAVFSYDAVTGARTICVNGSIYTSDKVSSTPLKTTRIYIGRGVSDANDTQFEGNIEEVRLMNSAASEAWIKTTALNLSESNSLVKLGNLEEFGLKFAPPAPPQLLGPVDGSQSHKPGGIMLQWLPSVGANEYDVLVSKAARSGQLLETIPAGAATEINLTAEQARDAAICWTIAAKSDHGETRSHQIYRLTFYDENVRGQATPPYRAVAPRLLRAVNLQIRLGDYFGHRIDRIAQYMIDFTRRNPGLLRMQRERPEKGVPPWAGVFAGQYLSSAQLVWRLTHNSELKVHVDAYVRDLIHTQRADGYLGPFENLNGSLELWNHYATLCGLLDYYEDTGYKPALDAARKIVDLVIKTYGPAHAVLPKEGGASESISHAVARLYRETHDPRYLNFANYLIHEVWNEPGGVAYFKLGQEHAPVSDFPVRRWESVNNIMALSEMYWSTGDKAYEDGFEHLWQALLKTERHNTGGFSTNEGLLGTPYHRGTIETCCTVAWSLLSTDMLRLSGDSHVADELEWSTLNSALASFPYDGSCSTYDNPPDGIRQYNRLNQGPPDGPELSCCSTNAARAIGNIANWALMQHNDDLVLNYYGPSKISADLPSGNRIGLEQITTYPVRGDIQLNVSMWKPETITFYLRIPAWSKQTRVMLNGKLLNTPTAGSYLPIRREWTTGDIIKLSLDFTPRVQTGEEDYAGKVSIYQGPILFASAARCDDAYRQHPTPLNLKELTIEPLEQHADKGFWVLAKMTDGDGKQLTVCDFSSAGLFGDYFQSWFEAMKPHSSTPIPNRCH